jgi:uncharacterized membrane protein YuzA (DUF378 family)
VLKPLDRVALLLVIVGAANWGLVGLFKFDLVAALVGEEFGQVNMVSRAVYGLVGLAGLYLIPAAARTTRATGRQAELRESHA